MWLILYRIGQNRSRVSKSPHDHNRIVKNCITVSTFAVYPIHFCQIRLKYSCIPNRIAKNYFTVSNYVVDPIQDRSKPLSCFKISSRSQQDREKLHYCFNFRGLPYTFLSKTFKVFLHPQQDCENVSECFIFLGRSYTLSRVS